MNLDLEGPMPIWMGLAFLALEFVFFRIIVWKINHGIQAATDYRQGIWAAGGGFLAASLAILLGPKLEERIKQIQGLNAGLPEPYLNVEAGIIPPSNKVVAQDGKKTGKGPS